MPRVVQKPPKTLAGRAFWAEGGEKVGRHRPVSPPLSREGRMIEFAFDVGDRVRKTGGDYMFVGHVIMRGTKIKSDAIRYVVENADGLLHIFNEQQLILIKKNALAD